MSAAAAGSDALKALESRLASLGQQVGELSAARMAAEADAAAAGTVSDGASEATAMASAALDAAAGEAEAARAAALHAADADGVLVGLLLAENGILHDELVRHRQAEHATVKGGDGADEQGGVLPAGSGLMSRGVELLVQVGVCAQIPGAERHCRPGSVQVIYNDERFFHADGCVMPEEWVGCIARSHEAHGDDDGVVKCWDDLFRGAARRLGCAGTCCVGELRSHPMWALIASSDGAAGESKTSLSASDPDTAAHARAPRAHGGLHRLARSLGTLVDLVGALLACRCYSRCAAVSCLAAGIA